MHSDLEQEHQARPVCASHADAGRFKRQSAISPLKALSVALLGLVGFQTQVQAQSEEAFTTFRNPPVFTGTDNVQQTGTRRGSTAAGALEYQRTVVPPGSLILDVNYVDTWIWDQVSGRYDRVRLRSYHGDPNAPLVSPTIQVSPGQRLNILLANNLPADDPSCRNRPANSHNTPNCFNTTNLHTHGLWVDPNGNSDNVFLAIKPGESQRYDIAIPPDHPAGTFWYHAHVHGSTALQVSSGMAGLLIIRGNRQPTPSTNGDLDTLLRSTRSIRMVERQVVFQQIQYACRNADGTVKKNANGTWKCDAGDVGTLESYDGTFGGGANGSNWRQSGRYTSVNGQTTPIFRQSVAGRMERWRMLHGGVRDTINFALRRIPLNGQPMPNLWRMSASQRRTFVNNFCTGAPLPHYLVASDGLTLPAMQRKEQTVFQPGYRWDALVTFPEAGYYCMLDESVPNDGNINAVASQQLLGIIEVQPGIRMNVTDIPNFVQQQMLSLASANAPAAVRSAVMADLRDSLKLTRYVPHRSIADSEVTNRDKPQQVTFAARFSGQPGASPLVFQVNDKSYDPNATPRILELNKVEEWHIRSEGLGGGHPFHIHVNPFQIVSVEKEGVDLSAPGARDSDGDTQYAGMKGSWRDTVMVKPGVVVKVRTRYQRYTGDFVLHCHILDHEDEGMMEHVRIVDPQRPESMTRAIPTHAHH